MKTMFLLALSLFLVMNGFSQSGLKTGNNAPEFTAVDNNGRQINLKALLKEHNNVVLFFYRGQWCPYCNKYVHQLQDSLQLLIGKGAYVVGVTPETDENIKKTVEKTHASFSMVQDKDYRIMKAYDVNYVLDNSTVEKYKKYGVDLENNNGNKDHVLPVPATYIINKSGKITYVHFDKNYMNRATIKTILSYL